MTLKEWRANPQLVSWAQKVFGGAEWRALNEIMQNVEHVRLYDTPGLEPLQKLGRIEGWDLYNSNLLSAASGMFAQELGPPTFEPDDPTPTDEAKPTTRKRK